MSEVNGDLYYIQNKGFCGNCLIWWRVDGHGYTLNLNEAWKVSRADAERICANRPEQDFAWKVDFMDTLSHRHVNSETVRLFAEKVSA